MSLAVVLTRGLAGLQAPLVRVEAHMGNGLPAFHIVGLPETEVKEARDRVRAAIETAGFEFPQRRITVNLAPADLPKESGRFDLPIADGHARGLGPGALAALAATRVRGRARPLGRAAPHSRRARDDARRAPRRPRLRAARVGRRARRRSRAGAIVHPARIAARRFARTSPVASAARPGRSAWRPPPRHDAPDLADVRGQVAGAARARDRRGRRALAPLLRPARHRQDHARATHCRDPAADDRAGSARSRRGAEPRDGRLRSAPIRRALLSQSRTTRPRPSRSWAAARRRVRARSRSRTTACSSSTSCPSSAATCSRCCASRSNRGASPSRAPRARRISPRPSSSSPR